MTLVPLFRQWAYLAIRSLVTARYRSQYSQLGKTDAYFPPWRVHSIFQHYETQKRGHFQVNTRLTSMSCDSSMCCLRVLTSSSGGYPRATTITCHVSGSMGSHCLAAPIEITHSWQLVKVLRITMTCWTLSETYISHPPPTAQGSFWKKGKTKYKSQRWWWLQEKRLPDAKHQLPIRTHSDYDGMHKTCISSRQTNI